MSKYTYTASLVDETVNILKRADQELSGTNAAVINAVNTILNARGADRLAFDFDDILAITDYARDDINAITKEILNKQTEIEEYENAPWWKKLFASIGMALLKFIEGHAQTIEYVFDLAVSLAGFIGGLFNSEFKASCKEFIEKEHVDNWFTERYIDENGLLHWINSNSVFSYNSTAANIIEFGGSLVNSLAMIGANPINGAVSLYKSFENLIDNSNIKAITTSTPILMPKIKEIFAIDVSEEPSSPRKDILPIADVPEGYPAPKDLNTGEGQLIAKDFFEKEENGKSLPKGNQSAPNVGESNSEQTLYESAPNVGESNSEQTLYEPVLPLVPDEKETLPEMLPEQEIISGEEVTPPQVLDGYSSIGKEDMLAPEEENITKPVQALYDSPLVNSEQTTGESTIIESHSETPPAIRIPTLTAAEEITKKSVGALGDLIDGAGSTPISSKPLSSKGNRGEGQMSAPLASGVIAAGLAGLGTKSYIDRRNSKSEEEKDKELELEQWDEEPENLSIDYQDGIMKEDEGDYLSAEDELAFIE